MRKNVLTFLYLPFSPPPLTCPPDAISSQSAVYLADQRIIFFNPQRANYNSSQLYLFFWGGKSAEHKSDDSAMTIVVVKAHDTPTHVSLKSPIKASIISLTWSREQRGCEITASEQLNTCQSDPQWQATLLLPTLITQINIKLNTRPCSVNFYVVRNDWLFASLHQRDQKYPGRISESWSPSRNPALCLLPSMHI